MKITIDDKIIEKYNLTRHQFFFMLSLIYKINDDGIDLLINKKYYVTQSYTSGIPQQNYTISHAGINVINQILRESENISIQQKSRFNDLAKSLQGLFPQGKKPGTNNYWKGNLPEIRERLISFFNRYGEFTDEVIIDATKKYIDNYQNDTRLMRTLKYFISKKIDGEVTSDLMTIIENKDSKDDTELVTTRLV